MSLSRYFVLQQSTNAWDIYFIPKLSLFSREDVQQEIAEADTCLHLLVWYPLSGDSFLQQNVLKQWHQRNFNDIFNSLSPLSEYIVMQQSSGLGTYTHRLWLDNFLITRYRLATKSVGFRNWKFYLYYSPYRGMASCNKIKGRNLDIVSDPNISLSQLASCNKHSSSSF